MIKLEVQPYCCDCLDFEPSVKEPQLIRVNLVGEEAEATHTDTIIRCKNARRCKSLVRYLEKQMKGEEV